MLIYTNVKDRLYIETFRDLCITSENLFFLVMQCEKVKDSDGNKACNNGSGSEPQWKRWDNSFMPAVLLWHWIAQNAIVNALNNYT